MPVPIGLIASFIPASLKEKLADSLVELLAGSAERLGGDQGDQIAGKIRRYSSRGQLLQSIDRALEAGIGRFIAEYTCQDEDLVDAIQGDELFWQSEVVQDALVKLVSRPGAWLGEERETMLRHFGAVLPQQIDRERVDKAVSFLLRCIAEELWSLPGAREIREAYSIQFQEISAEAQIEQVALARRQLQATTHMSADLQRALLQLIGLVEHKVLAAPAPAAVLVSPRPYHNLPQPIYTQFIGRDEELAWLRQRLSPADRAWQIAVTGIGGVGKSALALAIAHEYRERYNELEPEERFEAIVWVSAKEEVLTAFGRERANVPEQVLHALEDVYTAIARVLEREDITRAEPDEQNALVEKALKRQRVLLIMDNLESVKDDRIKAFLRNLPPPTKAIITSRESLDVADVKPLTGLRWEEAEALIEEECRVREVALTSQQRKRIFELTSGLPLPIKLGIARMIGGESFALVDRWLGDAVGELPEYCVKGQIDLVREREPNAWTMLFASALFDRDVGVSRVALGEIADLSLVDRDRSLAHLQRLFLVNRRDSDRFWVLPIVQRLVSARLSQHSESQIVVENWLQWLAGFAHMHGPYVEKDVEQFQAVGMEYPNLRTAIEWCCDHQHPDLLVKLCEGAVPYAYLQGLYTELLEMSEVWLQAADAATDQRAVGHAHLQLGRVYRIWNQVEEAEQHLDRAETLLTLEGSEAALIETWATRSQILNQKGQFAEAEALAQRMFEVGERCGNSDYLVLAAYRFEAIARNRGDMRQAFHWIDCAERWARSLKSPRRIAGVSYRRAANLVRIGQFVEAEPYLLEALEINSSMGERRFIAYDKLRLAEVYCATGRLLAARQSAQEARDIFDRLGIAEAVEETDAVIHRLSADIEVA
jgi:tetratricopeptide (TPR) repeat protein